MRTRYARQGRFAASQTPPTLRLLSTQKKQEGYCFCRTSLVATRRSGGAAGVIACGVGKRTVKIRPSVQDLAHASLPDHLHHLKQSWVKVRSQSLWFAVDEAFLTILMQISSRIPRPCRQSQVADTQSRPRRKEEDAQGPRKEAHYLQPSVSSYVQLSEKCILTRYGV